MLRKITKALLLITAITWIVWDFVPFFDPTPGDTISEVICYYALRCITLPFVFGVLVGHFFMPVSENAEQYPKSLITLLVLTIGIDILIYKINMIGVFHYPIIWVLTGIGVGAALWQQRRA